MKKILIVSFSFSMLCLLAACEGCKKPDIFPSTTKGPSDTLPPITTTGENTFGCLVDGKVWTPYDLFKEGINGGYANRGFNISASNNLSNEPLSGISIQFFSGIKDTGEYKIKFNNTSQGAAFCTYRIYNGIDSNYYYVDTIHTGLLHLLQLDSISHIISGTFEFEAYNAYLQKSVHITQGRFDFQYIH